MGEIMLTRIKSIYADLKGIYKSGVFNGRFVMNEIVETLNKKIDELGDISKTDYSDCKISNSCRWDKHSSESEYFAEMPKCNLERILSRLENEYGFERGEKFNATAPIIIENRNEQNQVSYNINYNIQNLINEAKNEEEKEKLTELEAELNKPEKNWNRIKNVLVWIINFSKDLFLKVLPIILEKYSK